MQTENTGSDIQRLIEIGWRRKWVILLPFVGIFLGVTLWALYQPNLYRSSSSIYIEPQKVPSDYVRSTVTTDIETRMRSISQQLTSRTKLLAVIQKLDLYPEEVGKGVPTEVLVANMRENLSIESPGHRDANFFMVHFVHPDPTKAMLAVSNLVSLFVEESLQVREVQAEDTTRFIEEELEKLKSTLEEQEQAVQRYKKMYMGELPNQLEANLRMLDNLQLQLNSNQESQRELDNRIMVLEQEVTRIEGELNAADAYASEEGETPVTDASLRQLLAQRDALRQRIAGMASQYTERHPDLQAARRELSRVEKDLAAIQEKLASENTSPGTPVVLPAQGYSRELANLQRQLTEVRLRQDSLRQEEVTLKSRIAQYQRRVEASPLREQQLTQLTRDYENTKNSYENLLTKKMEAQMSENLEKRQQGEKFQILDPANFPEKPFLPNRPKLIMMGFVGGLGSGFGLALLLETLFPAFYSLKQLQQQFPGIPIAFAVPYIDSRAERQRKRIRTALTLVLSLAAVVLGLVVIDHYVVDLAAFFKVIRANAKGML